LNFISHVIRTAPIFEAHQHADIEIEKERAAVTDNLAESMIFSKRRKVFNELDKVITLKNSKSVGRFSKLVPEYLFYTNLGRSDLVYFSEWKNKNKVT